MGCSWSMRNKVSVPRPDISINLTDDQKQIIKKTWIKIEENRTKIGKQTFIRWECWQLKKPFKLDMQNTQKLILLLYILVWKKMIFFIDTNEHMKQAEKHQIPFYEFNLIVSSIHKLFKIQLRVANLMNFRRNMSFKKLSVWWYFSS